MNEKQWLAERFEEHRAAPTVAQRPAHPAAPVALRPGRNQALLTLADGRTVLLDQAHLGLLAQQGGSQVQKTADGQLRYATSTATASQLLYNTVATPRGGQYQLRLPRRCASRWPSPGPSGAWS